MKRRVGFLIPCVLGITFLCGYVPPQDRKYVDYFLRLQAADLFRERSFLLNSSWSYVGQKKLERVDLRFSYFRSLTWDQARKLIVSVALELVDKINSDSMMKAKNLLPEPFTVDQLYLEIRTDNLCSEGADVVSIQYLYLNNGMLTYQSYPASSIFYGRTTTYKESFQQALMLLDLPTEFEAVHSDVVTVQKKAQRTVEDPESAKLVTSADVVQRTVEEADLSEMKAVVGASHLDIEGKNQLSVRKTDQTDTIGMVVDAVSNVFSSPEERGSTCRQYFVLSSFPQPIQRAKESIIVDRQEVALCPLVIGEKTKWQGAIFPESRQDIAVQRMQADNSSALLALGSGVVAVGGPIDEEKWQGAAFPESHQQGVVQHVQTDEAPVLLASEVMAVEIPIEKERSQVTEPGTKTSIESKEEPCVREEDTQLSLYQRAMAALASKKQEQMVESQIAEVEPVEDASLDEPVEGKGKSLYRRMMDWFSSEEQQVEENYTVSEAPQAKAELEFLHKEASPVSEAPEAKEELELLNKREKMGKEEEEENKPPRTEPQAPSENSSWLKVAPRERSAPPEQTVPVVEELSSKKVSEERPSSWFRVAPRDKAPPSVKQQTTPVTQEVPPETDSKEAAEKPNWFTVAPREKSTNTVASTQADDVTSESDATSAPWFKRMVQSFQEPPSEQKEMQPPKTEKQASSVGVFDRLVASVRSYCEPSSSLEDEDEDFEDDDLLDPIDADLRENE